MVKKAPMLFFLSVVLIAGLLSYAAYEALEVRFRDRLETTQKQIDLLSLKSDVQGSSGYSGPPVLVRTIPTELVLEFSGSSVPPKELSQKNVFRWYSLINTVQLEVINPDNHESRRFDIVNLIWIFDKPTTYIQADVSFSGVDLPEYEIKDQSLRSLIVSFKGQVPRGVLTLSLRQ